MTLKIGEIVTHSTYGIGLVVDNVADLPLARVYFPHKKEKPRKPSELIVTRFLDKRIDTVRVNECALLRP